MRQGVRVCVCVCVLRERECVRGGDGLGGVWERTVCSVLRTLCTNPLPHPPRHTLSPPPASRKLGSLDLGADGAAGGTEQQPQAPQQQQQREGEAGEEDGELAARLTEVYERMAEIGGASAESRASKILHGLGFTEVMQVGVACAAVCGWAAACTCEGWWGWGVGGKGWGGVSIALWMGGVGVERGRVLGRLGP